MTERKGGLGAPVHAPEREGNAAGSAFRRLAARVGGSRYARNVATMFTATATAQAVALVAAPLLTRLYDPSDFGIFAVYAGAIALLAVAVTGRYELAIMLPAEPSRALEIVALTIAVVVGSCILLATASPFASELLPLWLLRDGDASIVYLVPVGVAATALFQTLSYWAVYTRRFRRLGGAKVAQSAVSVAAQLAAGALGAGVEALVAAQIMGAVVGTGMLAMTVSSEERTRLSGTTLKVLRQTAWRYRRFPMFSLAADSTNILANQSPVFLLGGFFGPFSAGSFSLTQRVVGAPIGLVASSVLEVFRERSAREFRERGDCVSVFRSTLAVLSALGAVPFGLLFVFSPMLFAAVFGEEWREAGQYARMLVPMFYLRFVVSPLSYVFYVTEKQSYDLVWQLLLLVATMSAIWAGALLNDARYAIGLYAIGYSVLYLLYLWLSDRLAQGSAR